MVGEQPLLEAQGITKRFHHPKTVSVLQGVSLQIQAGESWAIVGRSGEGKSTLLQILGTLEQPCAGILRVDGKEVSSANRDRLRNMRIGFVFQSFHLLEDYTALDNVLMPARIARLPVGRGSVARHRALALLEQVGLADRAHFPSKWLSGGEKQRTALARAMCNDPSLILADEPSGNLDRQTAELIHEILLGFSCQKGKALLIVTHDAELAQLCTHRRELRHGRLI